MSSPDVWIVRNKEQAREPAQDFRMHEQQQWSRRNGKYGWRRRQLWRRWRRQWRRKWRGQHWSRKMMAKDEGWGSEWSSYKRNLLLDQKASVLFTRCVKFSNKTTWYIVLHVSFVPWGCLWFCLSWASVFSLAIFLSSLWNSGHCLVLESQMLTGFRRRPQRFIGWSVTVARGLQGSLSNLRSPEILWYWHDVSFFT